MDAENNRGRSSRRAILIKNKPVPLSRESYTPIGVEVVVKPVPIAVPTLAVPVRIRNVPVAIAVHHDRAESRPRHHPSNILRIESYSESKIP